MILASGYHSIKNSQIYFYALICGLGMMAIHHFIGGGMSGTAKFNYSIVLLSVFCLWGFQQQAYVQITRNQNMTVIGLLLRALFKMDLGLVRPDPNLVIVAAEGYDRRKRQILKERKIRNKKKNLLKEAGHE
ncbi:hypothetical protein CR158_10355 [Halomonas heilongjiangensis]|nr:hypothetical protein CR158_10355 [Halomonas heilongjiangensis]